MKMESQLSNWFRLAEQWGAVMLIDEADVFLEQRSKTDLHRNSLVSGEKPRNPHPVVTYTICWQPFSLPPLYRVLSRDFIPHHKSGWTVWRCLRISNPCDTKLWWSGGRAAQKYLGPILQQALRWEGRLFGHKASKVIHPWAGGGFHLQTQVEWTGDSKRYVLETKSWRALQSSGHIANRHALQYSRLQLR